ncbi:MAG: HAD family hydrolase [Deltaproteobacteria bacterium]|uniref:HAD family hydrolase n=1 Tax=Candidatus Zymogenus saltonus TaxID=2844893 RepID=A0A9D8KD88_9DELT|nr:HAD family hydrolase [Candidatus Zymogenus saltonus]
MLKDVLKVKKDVLVVSDFDGTISTRDISYELLRKFTKGGWEDINGEYIKGNIGSQEAFSRILETIEASRSEMIDFIEEISVVDPHFVQFHDYLKRQGIDLIIVSDGFKMYIDALMEKAGLNDIPIYANDIIEDENGRLKTVFPYYNEECGRCGTCKSNIVKKLLKEHDHIVFIGDGYSDSCAAAYPQTLFAKGFLYSHAAKEKIPCIHFDDFGDVHNEFEKDVKGVIFDLDETLVESLESIRTAFYYTLEKLNIDIGDAEMALKEMMHWPLSVGLEKIFADVDVNLLVTTFREKYHSIYLDMTTVKGGMVEILEALKDRGIKSTVATNKKGTYARTLIDHLGLSGYFVKVIGAGDVENPKPSPDMVEAAMLEMGTEKSQTIFVGDSRVDIVTGENSGVEVYCLAQSVDTPADLAKLKPKKFFYTTDELLRELAPK